MVCFYLNYKLFIIYLCIYLILISLNFMNIIIHLNNTIYMTYFIMLFKNLNNKYLIFLLI